MFQCPHCGESIEFEPPAEVESCQYNPGKAKASLGCNTLIIIAIIVTIFAEALDSSSELRDLRNSIQALEQKIDRLQIKPVVVVQTAPDLGNQ